MRLTEPTQDEGMLENALREIREVQGHMEYGTPIYLWLSVAGDLTKAALHQLNQEQEALGSKKEGETGQATSSGLFSNSPTDALLGPVFAVIKKQ